MNSGTKLFDFNTLVPTPATISPPPLILALPPLTPSLTPTCEPPSTLSALVLNILLRAAVAADLGGLGRVLEYTLPLPPIIEVVEEEEEEGSLVLVLARKLDENFESAEFGGRGEFRVPPPIPPAPPLLLLVPDRAVVLREDEVKSLAKGDLVGILI